MFENHNYILKIIATLLLQTNHLLVFNIFFLENPPKKNKQDKEIQHMDDPKSNPNILIVYAYIYKYIYIYALQNLQGPTCSYFLKRPCPEIDILPSINLYWLSQKPAVPQPDGLQWPGTTGSTAALGSHSSRRAWAFAALSKSAPPPAKFGAKESALVGRRMAVILGSGLALRFR